MGTISILMTLLISFGAGVGAPDCASACSDPASTGRWIVGLSLIVFLLLPIASSAARLLRRRNRTPLSPPPRLILRPRLDRAALRGMVAGKEWETA